ncbi:vomeronasal type-2 receptor 26-like [Ahaetulla prasina]|uniref:vomeronasal type-2 receptor 26-like n=1 Tax=Ahaetulla prasina TaxID=499056 RepID=UPI002648C250|nr:vomeronasal type-2 receptor 26-like [Ahaetulla prasina]
MHKAKCLLTLQQSEVDPQHHYKPGDYIISGIVSAMDARFQLLSFAGSPSTKFSQKSPKLYWKFMPFLFAIEDINRDDHLLPNITLGYNIYENFFKVEMTTDPLLDLLSDGEANVPNYRCGRQRNTVAVLEDVETGISIQMSTLLGTYKIPQISYNLASMTLMDKTHFPFFYPMLPTEGIEYPGITQLLLYFKWTLVGLIAPETDQGERFMRTMSSLMLRNGICAVLYQSFTLNFADMTFNSDEYYKWVKVNVFVYGSETSSFLIGMRIIDAILTHLSKHVVGKVWINTAQWVFSLDFMFNVYSLKHIGAFFSFLIKERKWASRGAFGIFIDFLVDFLEKTFRCSSPKDAFSVKVWRRCRQREELVSLRKEEIDQILTLDSYLIYNTIWAVGRALNSAYISTSKRSVRNRSMKMDAPRLKTWQPLPPSTCVESCRPGFKKVPQEGEPICCYDCHRCAEGTISAIEDAEKCTECPADQHPNINQDECIPKTETFLSFRENLGISLASLASFLSLVTGFVLGIFIKFRETPIVRANNRDLSYILLISLLLSFLTSFLFIGQPRKATCLLQQTAFSNIFTVAISTVLAKTVTVVLAFFATKPGNNLQRWLGKTLSNSIILSCSGVQVLLGSICVWISFVPTYLSTKGKYMVAVQVFSILASSTGLLGCIFIPKCYIIFLRPSLNTKEHLMSK